MHRLVYRSVALVPATDRENLNILRTAMARNSSMDVTGFLLRNPAYFYQCLEGAEPSLNKIMSSIISDTRHFAVEILMFDECTGRNYFFGLSAFFFSGLGSSRSLMSSKYLATTGR